jgi:hypothetical protein
MHLVLDRVLEETIGEETLKEDDLLGKSGGSQAMQPRKNSLNAAKA